MLRYLSLFFIKAMMWRLRVASFAFAGILFGGHVLANGVYISRPTIEEPVTVTSYVIIYDGTLTGMYPL